MTFEHEQKCKKVSQRRATFHSSPHCLIRANKFIICLASHKFNGRNKPIDFLRRQLLRQFTDQLDFLKSSIGLPLNLVFTQSCLILRDVQKMLLGFTSSLSSILPLIYRVSLRDLIFLQIFIKRISTSRAHRLVQSH
jgi:hypothetical protein